MAALLRDPWVRSVWLFVIYLAMFSLGVAIAVDPILPGFGAFDNWILIWVGVITALGGILGAMAQFRGAWGFERIAILFCMIGVATCFAAVIATRYRDPIYLTAELSVLTALTSSFGIRLYTIRGLDLSPYHTHSSR